MNLTDHRCPNCNRLLYRGDILRIQIKCPRCKQVVYHEILDLKEALNVHRDSHPIRTDK